MVTGESTTATRVPQKPQGYFKYIVLVKNNLSWKNLLIFLFLNIMAIRKKKKKKLADHIVLFAFKTKNCIKKSLYISYKKSKSGQDFNIKLNVIFSVKVEYIQKTKYVNKI